MKVILASGSPRRKQILQELGINFEVIKPEIDESRLDSESPEDLCRRLSQIKAGNISEKFPDELVIAADTIVVIDSEILGKPLNRNDAFKMLKHLQGREHEVMTGLTVCKKNISRSHVEHSFVKFKNLSDEEILSYIDSGESDDKAGAYAVQGKGAFLIENVRGDFYNVVGLPVFRLGQILESFGFRTI